MLTPVVGERLRLSVAGRTDAGVHAWGQVASFRTDSSVPPASIQAAVNGSLGPEVVVRDARYAPEGFDARFSASARSYRYVVNTGPVSDPFRSRFEWYRPGALAIPRMRAARASVWWGSTTSRRSAGTRGATGRPTRRLERLAIARDGERVVFGLRANAFLHQMVRSIVGTLLEVGDGRFDDDAVARMLAARDRSLDREGGTSPRPDARPGRLRRAVTPVTELAPRVVRWIEDSVGPGARVVSITEMAPSNTEKHDVLVVGANGSEHRLVLRRYADREGLAADPFLDPSNEARALRILEPTSVPAPRLYAADLAPDVCDVPALLESWVPGAPAWVPEDLDSYLSSAAETLVAIHEVASERPDGLPDYVPYAVADEIEPALPSWTGGPSSGNA